MIAAKTKFRQLVLAQGAVRHSVDWDQPSKIQHAFTFKEGIAMSKQKKRMGVIFLLLGTVVGAYCMRTATHPSSNITTGAMRTSLPQRLMQTPGVLPIPVIDYGD
jgi:hypothetical protein